MSRSLSDDERKTIRVTVKISPNDVKRYEEAGVKASQRVAFMRKHSDNALYAIIKGKKK